MIVQVKKKVKEGKVVNVKVEYDDIINDVKITGDFFLHPEDILAEIERSIIGLPRTADERIIASNIDRITAGKEVQMIGISQESLAVLIEEALK